MEVVLDNKPIRRKPSELLEPWKPARFPATEMSWQGKPAVITKASGDDRAAERIDLAKADGFPSDSVRGDCESADAAE
jgi:hypothetical protein